MEDALQDVQGERARFDARKCFPYAVLTPDGSNELGCLYSKPNPMQGFEATLVEDMKAWLHAAWPLEKDAWPTREIAAGDLKKLPDKPKK